MGGFGDAVDDVFSRLKHTGGAVEAPTPVAADADAEPMRPPRPTGLLLPMPSRVPGTSPPPTPPVRPVRTTAPSPVYPAATGRCCTAGTPCWPAPRRDLVRQLKLALSDEQNVVLELARGARSGRIQTDDLPAGDEAAGRYRPVAPPGAVGRAPGRLAGGPRFRRPRPGTARRRPTTQHPWTGPISSVVVDELIAALTDPLRERLADLAAGETDQLEDQVRNLYRDTRNQRVAGLAEHATLAAFAAGQLAAVRRRAAIVPPPRAPQRRSAGALGDPPAPTEVRWVFEACSPDCLDNSLAGPVPAGQPFPTGHLRPPAFPGCRCLLVRRRTDHPPRPRRHHCRLGSPAMRAPQDAARPRRRRRLSRRGRVLVAVAVAALLILFLSLRGIAGFYTDYLWYDSLDLRSVWSGLLAARIMLGLIFTGTFFVLLWVNLLVADRLAPRFRPSGPEEELLERYFEVVGRRTGLVRVAVSLLFAIIAGAGVSQQWNNWLLFTNRVDFGQDDPLFGIDIGFYVFQLPFLSFLVSWLFAAFVIILIITTVAHYLNGGIRLQTPGQRVTPQVKAHLSVLLGVLALVKAAGYWLQRYQLTVADTGFIDGAGYTDVKAKLPAIMLLLFISLFSFGLFLFNIRRRGWVLPVLAVGPVGVRGRGGRLRLPVVHPAVPGRAGRVEPGGARTSSATSPPPGRPTAWRRCAPRSSPPPNRSRPRSSPDKPPVTTCATCGCSTPRSWTTPSSAARPISAGCAFPRSWTSTAT